MARFVPAYRAGHNLLQNCRVTSNADRKIALFDRWVPVSTGRLQAVPAFLFVAADGESRQRTLRSSATRSVSQSATSSARGEPLARQPVLVNLRWHDLRHEYASRLVEKGVPLSQARDLLGHASLVTTERLETGETFNNPSSSDTHAASENPNQHADADDNSPTELEKGFRVDDGIEPAGASVACDARLRTVREPNSPKANWGG
jgi:Phage integrase family